MIVATVRKIIKNHTPEIQIILQLKLAMNYQWTVQLHKTFPSTLKKKKASVQPDKLNSQ